MDANLTVGRALHGIMGEGGTQQLPADTFETFSVATIDGHGGMQLHAAARDEHRC